MEGFSPWIIPLAVAVIAAIPALLGVLASRRATEAKESEIAVAGLAALVAEIQEERQLCREELAQVRLELGHVKRDLAKHRQATEGRRLSLADDAD